MTAIQYSEKKIVGTLFASQSLFSASTNLLFAVSSIEAVRLAGGNERWTGIPSTVSLIAGALMSYPIGRLMDTAGRRIGLTIGHILGVIGAVMAAAAIVQSSLLLYLLGVFMMGLARGPLELSRYIAADASPAERRGRAISIVVLGGTVGSISAPILIDIAHYLGPRIGMPQQAAPWGVAALLFLLGIVLVMMFLRPDPKLIAAHLSANEPVLAAQQGVARPTLQVLREWRAQLAIGAMVFSQLSMVIVMTITPQHMHNHHHADTAVTWVITAHTLGMFGLSFVTGWLVDYLGQSKAILIGGILSTLACALAPFSSSFGWMALTLFLLGLGWNFCLVAGSTLLDETLRTAEKGRVRGGAETIVKIASGIGSLGSGFLFASNGFAMTSWLTVIAAMIPALLVVFMALRRPPQVVETAPSAD